MCDERKNCQTRGKTQPGAAQRERERQEGRMIEREKEIMQKFLPRKINMKIKCKIYAAKKSGKQS